MQFWFTRSSAVPFREQIVTQVVLGVLCDDLKPGERLPSTRDLARRFRLHPNTVSAAYKQLQRERWVEFRRGSGVYVRKYRAGSPVSAAVAFDQLLANLVRSARELGFPLSTIHSHLRRWLEIHPPDRFLVIEPDEELRRILVAELRQAITFPIVSGGLDACHKQEVIAGAIPVALSSRTEMVRAALPAGLELVILTVRSVPASLGKWLPAPEDALIGIVSRWSGFLKSARTMLVAAGFHADSLVFRDARQKRWQRDFKQMAAVICDSATAAEAPKGCRLIPFPLISESAIDELQRYQAFVRAPVRSL